MLSQVLWVLDNETDSKRFERLCIDLLYRSGYKKIVPVGGMHDRGRDAESEEFTGIDEKGRITFFQFSQQKDWRQKLRIELRKVSQNQHEISSYVFVTSQDVSGRDKDQLRQDVKEEFGWDLVILSREWLRLQLEEAHPDLAYRHLGVRSPLLTHVFAEFFTFKQPEVTDLRKAWEYFVQEDFDRAASEFRDYLGKNPDIAQAWELYAWCLYRTFRYDEAIAAVNKALELSPGSEQTKSIRGCILAETGIQRGDKASVREASRIFSDLLEKSDDGLLHYNYANTLSEMKDYRGAIKHYRIALSKEPDDARIWKNLATAYHEIGQHSDEMECFDRALTLSPNLPQALISKGVSLMVDFDKPAEAIALIEQGISASQDFAIRWPHAWYWLAEAHRRLGEYQESLERIRQGLRHVPGDVYLHNLEFRVMADLANHDESDEVLGYFLRVVHENKLHYDARIEAIKILKRSGRVEDAWSLLAGAVAALLPEVSAPLRGIGFSLEECCVALEYLPSYVSHRRNWPVTDYERESFGEDNSRAFQDYINLAGAIVFGLTKAALVDAAEAGETRKHKMYVRIFSELLSHVQRYVASAVGFLASDLSRESEIEILSRRVAEVLVFAPEVVGEEWIRMYGWLLASFPMEEALQDKIISRFAKVKLRREMVKPILDNINKVAQIFPDESAT